MKQSLPRWDLTGIYPSLASAEYMRDKALLTERVKTIETLLQEQLDKPWSEDALLALIKAFELAEDTAENLNSYCEAIYTANTKDNAALEQINEVAALKLPLSKQTVLFRSLLAKNNGLALAQNSAALQAYQFFLTESVEKAAYQMTGEMEDLANDLARSGASAWTRLHAAVSSMAQAVWDKKTGERKTVIALRDLAHDSDRDIRRRAYHAELAAWQSVEIPLAAALNGIKGQAISIDARRGWKTVFQKSAFQARISEATLDALIAALESSLPLFRGYLKTKARFLGITQCAFYDLFAPVKKGAASIKKWSWQETADFITERFGEFDPSMAAFAGKVFAARWIDAEGREGKTGGAYCTDFPLAKESRIFCNFEGSFDSVTTVAHEIGHAWHANIIRVLPRFQTLAPMTLAETASIFAETIVFEGALKKANADESITLLEGSIKDACQVIVDILSRFYFERTLFERRARAELPPEELCAIMLDAQKKTYGDGLDSTALHPYMWAAKPHYYDYAFSFYNYPYAFGQLFALALYARAKAEGPSFAAAYRDLLKTTGSMSAEAAAKRAGFDLTKEEFWQQGLDVIAERIRQFF